MAKAIEPATLIIPRSSAVQKITAQIEKGKQLLGIKITTDAQLDDAWDAYRKWSSYNKELLKRMFSDSSFVDEYAPYSAATVRSSYSVGERIGWYVDAVRSKVVRLEGFLERLELIPEGTKNKQPTHTTAKNDLELTKLTIPQLFHNLSIPQVVGLLTFLFVLVTSSYTIGHQIHQWSLEEEKHALLEEKNHLVQEKQILVAQRDSLVKQLQTHSRLLAK
jgi:hypothetical protein